MRNIILNIVIALIALPTLSQSIIDSHDLKKGIYKNFNEFISNNPSIPLDESSVAISEDQEYLIQDVKKYSISYGKEIIIPVFQLEFKEAALKIDQKDIWGFCDGVNICINSFSHIPRHHFVKLLLVGRYCYFIQVGNPTNILSTKKGPLHNYKTLAEYIINVNNGKIFKLDKNMLEVILKKDAGLYEEFKNDKELKNKLMMDYIDKYNKLHADEIKMLK